MITGLTWLLGCQLAGELLVRTLDLPVPGSVVGMVVLLGLLAVRRPVAEATVFRAADGLLRHLHLFFVPAGVGVVVHLTTLRDQALPITVAMAGSWLAGLLVVGGATAVLVHARGGAGGPRREP